MKSVLIFVATFLASIGLTAQEWQTNFEDALSLAQENDQLILMVFKGSDWCIPCMKLEKEILSTSEFRELANEKFIFLSVDFPRRKKNQLSPDQSEHNAQLAEKYNQEGYFPKLVLIDANKEVLGSLGYEKIDPETYFNKLVKLI